VKAKVGSYPEGRAYGPVERSHPGGFFDYLLKISPAVGVLLSRKYLYWAGAEAGRPLKLFITEILAALWEAEDEK
jgi:hypothetical protein